MSPTSEERHQRWFWVNYGTFLCLFLFFYLWLHIGYQDHPQKSVSFFVMHNIWVVGLSALMALSGVILLEDGSHSQHLHFLTHLLRVVFQNKVGVLANLAMLALVVFLFHEFRLIRLQVQNAYAHARIQMCRNANQCRDIGPFLAETRRMLLPYEGQGQARVRVTDAFGFHTEDVPLQKFWDPVTFILRKQTLLEDKVDLGRHDKPFTLHIEYVDPSQTVVPVTVSLDSPTDPRLCDYPIPYYPTYRMFATKAMAALKEHDMKDTELTIEPMWIAQPPAKTFDLSYDAAAKQITLRQRTKVPRPREIDIVNLVGRVYDYLFVDSEDNQNAFPETLTDSIKEFNNLPVPQRAVAFGKLTKRIDAFRWSIQWAGNRQIRFGQFIKGILETTDWLDQETIALFYNKCQIFLDRHCDPDAVQDIVLCFVRLAEADQIRADFEGRYLGRLADFFKQESFTRLAHAVIQELVTCSRLRTRDRVEYARLVWALGASSSLEVRCRIQNDLLAHPEAGTHLNRLLVLISEYRPNHWPRESEVTTALLSRDPS